MKSFEVLPHAMGASVRVLASTRAGLATAALQGVFKVADGHVDTESDEKIERPFSVDATDFPGLLKGMLDQALAAAVQNGEAYDDVRFSLITEKQMDGAFIGKRSKGFATTITSVKGGMMISKNEADEWETTVVVGK